MLESVFNLFLFVSKNLVNEIGVVSHQVDGTDQDKLDFLQSQVDEDFKNAKRFYIPYRLSQFDDKGCLIPFQTERYQAMMRLGTQLELFEEIFQVFNASNSPLVVITWIVDGEVVIDARTSLEPLRMSEFQNSKITGLGIMDDYLEHYMSPNGFNIPKLINDDFMTSIMLLYNNNHFVSSAKLLFSFIDTVAYLEFGDVQGNFQQWLERYADLVSVGVNASELWEMRNSLLHMTNSDSRKVLSSKVRRLTFYIGNLPDKFPTEDEQAKYFSLNKFINVVIDALQNWFLSFNRDPRKIEDFISRYDRILSDTRYAIFSYEQ